MEKATDLLSSSQSFFSLKSLKLKTKQQELLLRISILGLVYILAFITRLFSVLRYESMIHEFDPYFNYRTTLYLTQKGFYEFWNWFDSESWYPLGRIIGGTLYPGLMVTAAFIYWILRFLRFAVHIREVCVLTAPFFASNTTLVAYFFGKELWDTGAGLVAAALIAICPGYISRSVAGSYDNEGVAIFALLLTFYLFVKAVKTGSLAWSLGSALGYFYMVSAWGGYVFIINLIPLYVLVLLVVGRYSMRLYVAYNCMYILGMLLAMQIRFVGFQHVQSGEHMAAMGVFFLMQVFYFLDWVKHLLNDQKLFQAFLRITLTCAISVGVIALGVGTASGYISPWTGRFYSLLDPTYAKDHIPIIASVSEHQPTAWSSFMFDFHILLILFPAGLYFCFKRLSDATIFIVMYGLTSMYFAGVMVRLILVATPAVCLISAIAVSATIKNLSLLVRAKTKPTQAGSGKGTTSTKASSKGALDQSLPYQKNGAIALLVGAFYLLTRYAIHCTWVTSEAYSSPSIVLAARGAHGNRVIFDDYREAYFWLRQNTPQDAKVMSWWDYGYQITAMGNRTVIVDNNTWNNTHIATVGRAMSSYEDEAYEIMRSLDVDYVLVVFGGVTGYSSDDINKFLWMVRIGGGVFPVIKEPDYLVNGEYRVDKGAAPKMLNCLMYKLSYYRFGELTTEYGQPPGYDRARGVEYFFLFQPSIEKLQEMTTHKAHCLILPYPVQGHINPMLQFSKRLRSKRVKITIALTKSFLKNMKELPTSMSIEAISDGYDDGGRDQAGTFVAYITRFKEIGSDTLSQLIQKLAISGCPVNCIVYDPFLPWAVEVAKQFGLISAAFFTQNCVVDNLYYHVHKGVIKLPPTQNDEEILIPGFPNSIDASDVPSFVISPEAERIVEMLANQFSNLDKVDCVLINSFYELEKEVIDWMSKIYPIKTIGPTIPSMYLDKRLHDDKEYGLSMFKPMTNECLNWLNHQPISSVLYVSFGSLAKLGSEQMEELAWGLKNSNKSFLWVVRSTEEPKLPNNFIEELTSEKGLVVSWCPQLQVLEHESIGCFLTHCGWNSTLEAISLGVPMVAMPQWSDQPTNAKLVKDVWEIGVRAKQDEKGIVRREVIEECIKLVMEEDKGKLIRENAKKWKEIARNVVDEGGSSDKNIEEFVSKLVTIS